MISAANVAAARRCRRVPYPHMGPADSKVWAACLAAGLFPADSYEYDVRLGGASAAQVPEEHEHRVMWETLLMKRIDVVAWRGAVPWIVEVKPVASFAALGQALGYGDLWEREKGPGSKPSLAVCCAYCDEDLAPTFSRFGVSVVVAPSSAPMDQTLTGLALEMQRAT